MSLSGIVECSCLLYRFACAEGQGANEVQSVLPAEVHGLMSEPYAETGSRQKLRRFLHEGLGQTQELSPVVTEVPGEKVGTRV